MKKKSLAILVAFVIVISLVAPAMAATEEFTGANSVNGFSGGSFVENNGYFVGTYTIT